MRQVLLRASHLLRSPALWVLFLTVTLGGSALTFLPLFHVPGYELSAALTVLLGLFGGAVGIAAARLERNMVQGRDPRPAGALRSDSALRTALTPLTSAALLNVASLAPPLLVSALVGHFATPCDPFTHLGFFPVLTLPSALLAAAAGAACGFASERRWVSALLYAALLLGSLAYSLWPVVFGPQVFAYDHFLGYLPGPLYDESLHVGRPLLAHRTATLLWTALVVAFTAACLDMRQGRLRRPYFRPGSVLLLVALAAGIFALEQRATHWGFRMTSAALAEALGGLRQTEHFTVHYPRGASPEHVERLARDLEFRHHQIAGFLGAAPEPRIRVYVYRSRQQKQQLVGAALTQFAKPWRLELHVNDSAFPHPVLKHELVHVMAAPFGAGPFRVTTRWGLWPLIGVIEGVAVAADAPLDELTLHEWSAGMRRQKLMPDIRTLLQPAGFYQAPPARAYTAAGSFFRFLADTYGAEKLRALYAHGDFGGVYGQPLDALAREWETFLDAVPLDEAAVQLAFARFRRASLFARTCAREVVQLHEEAERVGGTDPERAAELWGRCADLQPEEVGYRIREAQALARCDRLEQAEAILQTEEPRVAQQPMWQAELALARADLARRRDDLEGARAQLDRVLELDVAPGVRRLALVKRAALAGGVAGEALWESLEPGNEEVKLLGLREALEGAAPEPHLLYLLGRRLLALNAPRRAAVYLTQALMGALAPELQREGYQLKLKADFMAGDCGQVRTTAGALPSYGAVDRARAQEWVERCDFEARTFDSALLPKGPFR